MRLKREDEISFISESYTGKGNMTAVHYVILTSAEPANSLHNGKLRHDNVEYWKTHPRGVGHGR